MTPKFMARLLAFVALSMAAACNVTVNTGSNGEELAEGFTMEILADGDDQIYLVRHSDGRESAARVANGVSELIDGRAALAAFDAAPQSFVAEAADADVSIKAPGFSLSVAGVQDNGNGEDGAARIEINAGGESVLVDAAGSDANGRARVRIGGADDEAARDFINGADDLSPETKAAMLAALGL